MTALIELVNITKRFGDRTVLNNVTLQVQEGEILALLGPNGSGKSTLLKLMAFLLHPDTGEIRFQNVPVTVKNSERMRLQSTLVFQKTLVLNTNVFNNVAYGLKARKIPKTQIAEVVKKALKLVKLEGFEKRPARKLLLLDEPAANLDPKNAGILEEVIATANREMKTAIVMATHNMFQAKTLPTRIALINDGSITEVGAPAEIFSKLSKNLASFAAVGNTFRGTARATSEGTTIVDVGNDVQVEVTGQRQGEVSVFVNPQDIILSKSALESSARNVFRGRITEISDLGSLVKLKVDVGKAFTVQITKRSFNEMELNLNAEVYIAFKASSVQVL